MHVFDTPGPMFAPESWNLICRDAGCEKALDPRHCFRNKIQSAVFLQSVLFLLSAAFEHLRNVLNTSFALPLPLSHPDDLQEMTCHSSTLKPSPDCISSKSCKHAASLPISTLTYPHKHTQTHLWL